MSIDKELSINIATEKDLSAIAYMSRDLIEADLA